MPALQTVTTPAELRSALAEARRQGQSVGLVPTMGFLHEGHATLIRRSAAENALTVVSVFVNPTQFAPTEDLAAYPRDLARDQTVAQEAGAALLFHPQPQDMYPPGHATSVSVAGLSTRVEGASRPGHFDGVATVVLKLLNLVQPTRAYFGEKDWQQLAVVRRMAADLFLNTEVVGVPTVRAQSGLALSSRNSYLSAERQAQAAVVSRALRAVQAAYAGGEQDAQALLAAGHAVLAQEPVDLDYLHLLDAELQPLQGQLTPQQAAQARLVFAGRLHAVRLIDNMPLVPGEQVQQGPTPGAPL
ncbi:Pantothenate synthetase [Deinococcus proteolyticus MRP]|uniref:Pantothenate synthetase n=1 Tax=Deinococcus proteolyticus (strain ATCC 35074 / DSM 20540 / JCM 6276 / NBRC 101906 / NCIMB 13154 / VKM Ac-1939 / CCM 2703 / MRP) TaxID=693977 RepID=F0RM63_DEIPM|nr:pantoate--beta-alanine ligase [Deinococcus proteolyticus]ADY25983.1 Pantothenate synthetase [Deinococcus proteolyticus MRP]